MLTDRGWFVMETHGNAFQKGLPDIFCCHTKHGHRWVECKNPDAYAFTPAQKITFPQLTCNGSGVWIIIAATEKEYLKLFTSPNWHFYLKVYKKSHMPPGPSVNPVTGRPIFKSR